MYTTTDEVLEDFDITKLRKELKAQGVKYANFEKEEALAKKYLEFLNPTQKPDENPDPKQADENSFEAWVEKAKKGKKSVKKGKNTGPKKYISKVFNFRLAPNGISKSGSMIRYVKGLSTLDLEEQGKIAKTFKLDHILFRGIEDSTLKMESFLGRGFLQTEDETLQEFLENNERFGTDYIIYDEASLIQKDLVKDRMITELKNAVYNGNRHDIIRVLTYLDMRNGADSFSALNATLNESILHQKCINYITNNPDLFMEAMADQYSKLVYLSNLAHSKGVISVSSDGRQVTLSENQKPLIQSPMTSDWQVDFADYLISPEGKDLLRKLEVRCSYKLN